jgi:hypothetical protein
MREGAWMMKQKQPPTSLPTTYIDGIGIERCAVCLELWPCGVEHKVVMLDMKSMELAVLFLSDEAEVIANDRHAISRVAQAIQDTAWAACEDERRRAVAAMDAKDR